MSEADLLAQPIYERLDVHKEGRLHLISTELLVGVMLYGLQRKLGAR